MRKVRAYLMQAKTVQLLGGNPADLLGDLPEVIPAEAKRAAEQAANQGQGQENSQAEQQQNNNSNMRQRTNMFQQANNSNNNNAKRSKLVDTRGNVSNYDVDVNWTEAAVQRVSSEIQFQMSEQELVQQQQIQQMQQARFNEDPFGPRSSPVTAEIPSPVAGGRPSSKTVTDKAGRAITVLREHDPNVFYGEIHKEHVC